MWACSYKLVLWLNCFPVSYHKLFFVYSAKLARIPVIDQFPFIIHQTVYKAMLNDSVSELPGCWRQVWAHCLCLVHLKDTVFGLDFLCADCAVITMPTRYAGKFNPDLESNLTQTLQTKELNSCQFHILHQIINITRSRETNHTWDHTSLRLSSTSPAYYLMNSHSPCTLLEDCKDSKTTMFNYIFSNA